MAHLVEPSLLNLDVAVLISSGVLDAILLDAYKKRDDNFSYNAISDCIMSLCLGYVTAVRQHNNRASFPAITAKHCRNMTARLLTVMLNHNSNPVKPQLKSNDFPHFK